MKIFVAGSAYRDFEEVKEYYKEAGVPHIGRELITAIIGHIQALADNPDIGRMVQEFGDKRIRELIHPPYRIVYIREHGSINVVRVWRSERLLKLPV